MFKKKNKVAVVLSDRNDQLFTVLPSCKKAATMSADIIVLKTERGEWVNRHYFSLVSISVDCWSSRQELISRLFFFSTSSDRINLQDWYVLIINFSLFLIVSYFNSMYCLRLIKMSSSTITMRSPSGLKWSMSNISTAHDPHSIMKECRRIKYIHV